MDVAHLITLAGVAVALIAVLLSYRTGRNSTAPAVIAGVAQYDLDDDDAVIVAIKNSGLGPAYFVTVDVEDGRIEAATIAIVAQGEGFGIKSIESVESRLWITKVYTL